MKKSIKAIIAATFTAALLAGCSSGTGSSATTAAETTAAETSVEATTAAESADAADTALADGSYTIGINQFAVHGSLDNCGKVSSKVSPRTDSWKAKILPY